jgi:hypothetical protein
MAKSDYTGDSILTRSEHEDEVPGRADALEEVVVELSGLQPVDVQEDGEVPDLEVDLEEAGQLGAVGAAVADEDVEVLVDARVVGDAELAALHFDP